MNFNVDVRYSDAVNNFNAVTVDNESPIPSNDFEALVNDVGTKIIEASKFKPTLRALGGREFSLREVGYILVQDRDKQYGKDTPEKIANASPQEKEIVAHVIRKLSQDFVQVTPEDLKAFTLLFGIHRIRELATGKIIAQPQQQLVYKIEAMEADLQKLISTRSQYSFSEETPQATKDLIAQVDTTIQQRTAELNQLKSQQNQAVV